MSVRFTVVNNTPSDAPSISYGSTTGTISIPAHGLLWESGISGQYINTGEWQGIPALFTAPGYTIPFDLFSAIFYLLSRYEEYLPYTPDKHGRYPHTDSILYRHGWMQRPLVDEWLMLFANLLRRELKLDIPQQEFSFSPTYDIDIAWAYRNKGFLRQTGALLKDVLKGNAKAIGERLAVAAGSRPDPYDSFSWIKALHQCYKMPARFFILAALRTGAFDKNISPRHPQMQALICSLAVYGQVGLHPSYNSADDAVYEEERSILEGITGQRITHSRQHYIRFRLPHTYRGLLQRSITDDYSMGWTDSVGFRAGTGRSFAWYDLEAEQETALTVHPFCFMDTAARFGCCWNATTAFENLRTMASVLQETDSQLITVFHNFSLGTDEGWSGWSELYEEMFEL